MAYSDDNSFEKILDRCLANDRLASLDKRPGSIIYDALAPVCLELASAYAKMDILEQQTYFMTAIGDSLDLRVYDYGVERRAATYAQRIGEFKKYKTDSDGNYERDADGDRILVDMQVPEGIRFAVPGDASVTYAYEGKTDGYDILRCEQAGTKGNAHVGQILPLTPLAGLVEARITSTYVPASDTETDDELKSRVREKLNYQSFGGNVYDYIERVNAIEGVGQTKVFPAWRDNGSVLLSVVDPLYAPITREFAARIKEIVDPVERTGEGVGTAPIGHFVTVATPARFPVDISMEIDSTRPASSIQEEVEGVLDDYVTSLRRTWKQDGVIGILRAQVINKVLDVVSVINVRNVRLNGEDDDILLSDSNDAITLDDGVITGHRLPYLGSVTVE